VININELIHDPDFKQILVRENEKFDAIVQYLSDDEMQRLPEGERYKDHIRIDTDFGLNLQDVIVWHGIKYRIIYMQDWSDYGYKNYTGVRFDGLESDDSEGFKLT